MEPFWTHRHQQLLPLQTKQTENNIFSSQSMDSGIQGKIHEYQRLQLNCHFLR